jgi:hypothetical protein
MARSKAAQATKAPTTARMRTVRAIEDAAQDAPATAIGAAMRLAATTTREALRPRSVRVAL